MNRKGIISILVIVLVIVGFYFILQNNKKKNQEKVDIVAQTNSDVAVNVVTVKKENIDSEFDVNGTFLPNKKSDISAEMGGQIVGLYVQEGSIVAPGQIIAKLKGDKINVNLSNAQANLDQAISALNRYEAAYKTGGITALQLDQARLQVKNARAQVQSAQLTSGDTNVIAKIGGIVNSKKVEIGMVVGAGTPIVDIVDISALKLKVEVDESLVSRLALADVVEVKTNVTNETISGVITFIAPASNGALKFPVEITIPNSSYALKAGMYGTALFKNQGNGSQIMIPRKAFVGGVSDNLIFVVRDGIAYLTKIQSGEAHGDEVEVLSGLQEGDVVVTDGQINLTDKTKVKILK